MRGLFRLALPDGTVRLARGDAEAGPTELLAEGVGLDDLLADADGPAGRPLHDALHGPAAGPVPTGARLLVPLAGQEVWA
ncbi:hypothetical protein ACQ7B2_29765, partial [Escherichia coli]